MSSETLNYYEILDVAPDASQELIFEAYQEAQTTFSLSNSSLYKVFSETEARDWLDLIEEAYSVIGFPNTRRVYDMELEGLFADNLPSFELEAKRSKVAKTLPQNSPLQESTLSKQVTDEQANTEVSQYQINPGMEELIEKQELFDGLFLKKVREYKNIDLTDFSKLTCIAIRHLYAIENNNFSVLPAAVFVRGYIIQYCRILNLDEKKVVSSFMSLLIDD